MRKLALAVGTLIIGSTTSAMAQGVPKSLNEPPRGPGTETKPGIMPGPERVEPGWEVAGQAGGGVGFGLGARAGYTIDYGFYLGGSFTHFWGSSIDTINGDQRTSRNILGGDIGYKMFFFTKALEVRPFVLLGVDWFHENHPETRSMSSEAGFAVQPSALVAYHIGPAFLSAEGRLMLTPTPVHVSVFGGIGMGL